MVNWDKLNDSDRQHYECVMNDCLDKIDIPHILHGNHLCNDPTHICDIERYYNELINCIKTADLQLPRCKPTMKKNFWDDNLSRLKNDSIIAHDF